MAFAYEKQPVGAVDPARQDHAGGELIEQDFADLPGQVDQVRDLQEEADRLGIIGGARL